MEGIDSLRNVKVIATYSELFGGKLPKEHIIKLIDNMPLLSSFILLSQISTDDFEEDTLKKLFKEMYTNMISNNLTEQGYPKKIMEGVSQNLINKFEEIIEKNVVFSNQSILQLWKWILAYGDPNKIGDFQGTPESVNSTLYLSLSINDYLYTGDGEISEELFVELYNNAIFNNVDHIYHTLCRTMLVYTEIASNKDLYEPNEFLDINKDFLDSYGYTIKEYISVIFALMSVFRKPKNLGDEWLRNIDELFKDFNIEEPAKEIVLSLMTDFNSISQWAKEEIDSTWNFIELTKKPLLRVDENKFLPFSTNLVYEQLFTNLFFKVRNCYPAKDESFFTFYGKPFERYTQKLAEHSVNQSKLPYQFVDEFRYGKDKSKHSPDIMIRLGDKLLAVEVKSYKLPLASITKATKDSVKSDMNKMVIKPIKQLHDRLKEIRQENHPVLNGVNEIYLMVITQGHFPTIEYFETMIEKEIMDYMEFPIKGYFHLDIEEFESFCQLMERRRPIFRVLDNKYKNVNRYQRFKNFFFDNGYHLKHNKLFNENFEKFIDEIGTTFLDDFIQRKQERNKIKQ